MIPFLNGCIVENEDQKHVGLSQIANRFYLSVFVIWTRSLAMMAATVAW